MAYIIAEPCIGTKDTACVDACPVDCIHPKKNTTYDDGRPTYGDVPQLYIDPVECIDCGACVPVCPVTAIFALDGTASVNDLCGCKRSIFSAGVGRRKRGFRHSASSLLRRLAEPVPWARKSWPLERDV